MLRNGDFERVLMPGKHRLWSLFDKLCVEIFSIDQAAFTHALSEYLLTQEPRVVGAYFVPAVLSETQVGLRYENGVLAEILAPSTRRLFWKGLVDTRIDVVDIADQIQVPPSVAALLKQRSCVAALWLACKAWCNCKCLSMARVCSGWMASWIASWVQALGPSGSSTA
ncbi:MAG: hypothetical protein HC858_10370, partial [Brachymonas sp.]|nr:hypothetical protein [Brachymonas sp.]